MNIDVNEVLNNLASRISQLEIDKAVLQAENKELTKKLQEEIEKNQDDSMKGDVDNEHQ